MRSREEATTVGKNAAVIIERPAGRLDEVTASVRQYLVAEIEELKGDAQLLELLRDSIEGNIDTIFSAIQYDIPIEHIEPPAAALEYAGRLAQHGVAPNALVRACRLGQNPSALADPRAEQEADRDNCRRRHGARWLTTAATVVAAILAVAAAVPAAPVARADDRHYEEFYTPPSPLPPGQPGDLIRTEPSRLVLEPSGQLGAYVGTGTRIMYRSTDAQGKPVAVTGTYIEPDVPWPGNGPRPLLAYATGPYGAGEQCAPSRLFNQGIHFSQGFDLMFHLEEGFFATLLARGFALVVTDGVGMGIHGPESPQFLNRVAAGTALIDAARAAKKLPGTSLEPDGPVAFWGFASGGQASLSAAELASTYGPELNIVGTFADAPLTEIVESIPGIDGNFLAVLFGYLLRGIIASYPETEQLIRDVLTPRGLQTLDWSGHTCVLQGGVDYAFRHLQFWFNTDLNALVSNDPFKSLLAAQRVGNIKPKGPVYISHNRWDPLLPYQAARKTAADWCAMGADVQLWTNEQPPLFNKLDINSLLPLYVDGERSMAWLADRFNGVPTTPNCGELQG